MKRPKNSIIIFFALVIGTFFIVMIFNPVKTSNPLKTILLITGINIIISFLFGLKTGDYSWTDRIWSIVPIGFSWIYAASNPANPTGWLAFLLIALWGIRLTANFARKGGYTQEQDYRWTILQSRIHTKIGWQAFNLFFIACYQQVLFICFTLPLYFLNNTPLNITMILALVFMFAFLVLETLADQQQYSFQQAKYGLLPTNPLSEADYKKGFKTSGLFARSRHPNYLGELGFWWSLYIFSALGNGIWWSPSLLGPILLTLLFLGSTGFTEQITAGKYPQYQEYKKSTWPILFRPW
ncbi:DUF1295 domain-containing protein [uncultured Sphaerochaeta sp.]|uniref:DUF1295 domain-containing protein n=1 Tax=uncultured Sphaerochaeta sp. TaxID=886478 RepID=UPI002A0A805F|nr:DUF1295 domain-containing protein [uncultured Sphaerochaeta sp.]